MTQLAGRLHESRRTDSSSGPALPADAVFDQVIVNVQTAVINIADQSLPELSV